MKIPRWYQKRIIGTTSNSCWQELEAKIYDKQWNVEKGLMSNPVSIGIWSNNFVYVFFFLFKEELEVTTKLTLSVCGSAGVKAMAILFERWRGRRLLVSAIPVWKCLWRWCMHGWPRCEIMHCVPIRYIRNKYLIYIILVWGVASAEDSRISRFICSPFTNTGYGQFVSCIVALITTVTFDPLDIENNSV